MTPEEAEKVLQKDWVNIVRKAVNGKPLTASERARIEARAAGCTDSTAYVKTLVELAALLGVTRRTLHNWQKLPGAPKAMSNGEYPVAEWREFVRVRGLKTGHPVTTNDEALKARKLLAEVEERELKLAIKRGHFVALDQVRQEWTTRVGQAIALMRARLEMEAPPILAGLDAFGIQDRLAKIIDEICAALHSGDATTP
jgi:DNA-binding transcriptional MerR regulator